MNNSQYRPLLTCFFSIFLYQLRPGPSLIEAFLSRRGTKIVSDFVFPNGQYLISAILISELMRSTSRGRSRAYAVVSGRLRIHAHGSSKYGLQLEQDKLAPYIEPPPPHSLMKHWTSII